MKRTDIHRPSVINPEEYEFVAMSGGHCCSLDDALYMKEERQRLWDHMETTGAVFSEHDHGGTCHVCGAWANLMAIYYHRSTNSYIKVGETCSDKMSDGEAINFNAARRSINDAKAAQAGKRKAQITLNELALEKAYEIFSTVNSYTCPKEESLVFDIVSKLVRYGNISEKQVDFLKKLLYQIENREEIKKQRELEKELAKPCPTGRMEIEGVVVSVKGHDSMYGWSLKMTVKTKDGYIVWGTVPDGAEINVKDWVCFRGTLTPSDKDEKFGFFKRPVILRVAKGS